MPDLASLALRADLFNVILAEAAAVAVNFDTIPAALPIPAEHYYLMRDGDAGRLGPFIVGAPGELSIQPRCLRVPVVGALPAVGANYVSPDVGDFLVPQRAGAAIVYNRNYYIDGVAQGPTLARADSHAGKELFVEITATAGGRTSKPARSAVVVVSAAPVTQPIITGSANVNLPEGNKTVQTITANKPLTWTLSGADAGLYQIGAGPSTSAQLEFKDTAPNFEAPNDAGTNNVYNVTIIGTDSGGLTASLNHTTTITDVAELPDAYASAGWTLTDSPSTNGNMLSIGIVTNPPGNGAAGTSIEYDFNEGGTVYTLANGVATGERIVQVYAGRLNELRVRLRNSVGPGPWSVLKSLRPSQSGVAVGTDFSAPAKFGAAYSSTATTTAGSGPFSYAGLPPGITVTVSGTTATATGTPT